MGRLYSNIQIQCFLFSTISPPTNTEALPDYPDFCSKTWEDASSVATFKACVNALCQFQPDFFILENVDMSSDDDESSLSQIHSLLEECNYNVRTFKMVSTDFGLPQRRVRLFIGGFHRDKQGQSSLTKVEKLLQVMRIKCQKPDSSMI